MSYLRYVCFFSHSGVQLIVMSFLFCLSSSCIFLTLCCQFLWIVNSWFPLRFSLTFIYRMKAIGNVPVGGLNTHWLLSGDFIFIILLAENDYTKLTTS
jgi:hypothetical protein